MGSRGTEILESERSLMGSIFLDHARVMGLCREAGLTKDAFTAKEHRTIYPACMWLTENGAPIDSATVADLLEKHGKLVDAGGREYFEHLIDHTPTAAHAEYYLKEVRDRWMLKSVEEESRRALDAARTGNEDPGAIIADHVQRLISLAEPKGSPSKGDAWTEIEKQYEQASDGESPGLEAPWPAFSRHTGGAPKGVLTIVAGREGTRKSFLVMQWAVHATLGARNAMPGAYFPFEDGTGIAMRRAACVMADLNPYSHIQGTMTDEEKDRVNHCGRRLVASDLDFVGGRGRSVDDIAIAVARGVARHGWGFVILDAFKDMYSKGGGDNGSGDKYKSSRLFDMAERHNIPVIVVHHVRKMVGDDEGYGDKEDQWLSYRDIKGFTEITADARMIMMLQCRARRASEGEVVNGVVKRAKELILEDFVLDCQKNNHGPTGKMNLLVDEDTGKFTEGNR